MARNDLAVAQLILGGIYLDMGQVDDAERFLVRSHATLKQVLNEDHPRLAESFGSLARLHINKGDHGRGQ